MNILVCGANGFIGRALCRALERDGHQVRRGVRHASQANEIAIDYTADLDPSIWSERLRDIDVVINAVGILVERSGQTFDAVHRRAPSALFDASVRAGVKRIVQISALGAQTGDTRYFASKLAADQHLQTLPIPYRIFRPALVFGRTGSSSRFFRALASLPVHVLPAGGHQRLRPIHIEELAEIVARCVSAGAQDQQVAELAGGTEVEYRQMLAMYRAAMLLGPALRVSIPAVLVDMGAALLDHVPHSMLTRDTWRMLQAGSTTEVAPTVAALGHRPAGIETFIAADDALAIRREAFSAWHPLLLRGALAATWIWTAIVSALIYPREASLALLARVHLHDGAALTALYAAAALDCAFGVATLIGPGRRLWEMQAALVTAYSIVIAIALPEFLFHPFGPILKNLPILAILLILFSEEVRP